MKTKEERRRRRKMYAKVVKLQGQQEFNFTQPKEVKMSESTSLSRRGKPRNHTTAEPTFLRTLVERTSIAEASKAIGISGSYIGQLLAGKEKCKLAYELAAKHVFEKSFGSVEANSTILVTLSRTHMPTVAQLVETLGGSVKPIQ